MFNKERFYNQLALNLGYELLLNDTRYFIKVSYISKDEPVVTIQNTDNQKYVINVLDNVEDTLLKELPSDMETILQAVYHAYKKATTNPL